MSIAPQQQSSEPTNPTATRSPPVAGSALNFARGASSNITSANPPSPQNSPPSAPTPPSHSRGSDAPRPNRVSSNRTSPTSTASSSSSSTSTPYDQQREGNNREATATATTTTISTGSPSKKKSSKKSSSKSKGTTSKKLKSSKRNSEFEGLANVCTDDNLSSSLDDYDPNRVNDKARYVEAKSGSKFQVTDCRRTVRVAATTFTATTTTTDGGSSGDKNLADSVSSVASSSLSFRTDLDPQLQLAQREDAKREISQKEAKEREQANTIGCQEALRRMEVLMGEAVEYHRRKGSYVLQQKLLDQMRSKYGPGMNPRLHATRTSQNYLRAQARRDEQVERWKAQQQQQLILLQTQQQQSIVSFIPSDALPPPRGGNGGGGNNSSQNNGSSNNSNNTLNNSSLAGSSGQLHNIQQQQHYHHHISPPQAPGAMTHGKTVPSGSSLTAGSSIHSSAPGLSSECGDHGEQMMVDQDDQVEEEEIASSLDSHEVVTPLSSLRDDLRNQAQQFGREDFGIGGGGSSPVNPRISPATAVSPYGGVIPPPVVTTTPGSSNPSAALSRGGGAGNTSSSNNSLQVSRSEGSMNRAALSGSSSTVHHDTTTWALPSDADQGSVRSGSTGSTTTGRSGGGGAAASQQQSFTTQVLGGSLPQQRPSRLLQPSSSDNSLELSSSATSGSVNRNNQSLNSASTLLLSSPYVPSAPPPAFVHLHNTLPRISNDPNQLIPKNILFDALAEVLLLDLRVIFLRNPVQGFQLSRKFFGEIRLWEL